MNDSARPDPTQALTDDVTETGVFHAVVDGYDAVFDALPRSETFNRLWRTHAYGGDFPEQFAPLGFLTLPEAQRLHELLQIAPRDVLVDLACGAGGPGLWMTKESRATLIGIDPSAAGLATARQRANDLGLADRARFQQGTFEQTNLPDATADAAMSIEAFQYTPINTPRSTSSHACSGPPRESGSSASKSTPPRSRASPCSASTPSSTTDPSSTPPA
jgi:SAM-dependent methyltransferase